MKVTREVHIFQCPVSIGYCFMPLSMVESLVDLTDYVRVWHGLIELEIPEGANEETIRQAVCEKCFDRFQDGRDKTFFGRSLTTSDIVCIANEKVIRYYYCDTIGWKLIKTQNV